MSADALTQALPLARRHAKAKGLIGEALEREARKFAAEMVAAEAVYVPGELTAKDFEQSVELARKQPQRSEPPVRIDVSTLSAPMSKKETKRALREQKDQQDVFEVRQRDGSFRAFHYRDGRFHRAPKLDRVLAERIAAASSRGTTREQGAGQTRRQRVASASGSRDRPHPGEPDPHISRSVWRGVEAASVRMFGHIQRRNAAMRLA